MSAKDGPDACLQFEEEQRELEARMKQLQSESQLINMRQMRLQSELAEMEAQCEVARKKALEKQRQDEKRERKEAKERARIAKKKARTLALEPDNRRVNPRVDFQVELSMLSDDTVYLGLTENISLGGLFVATYELRPLGTRLKIGVRIDGTDFELPVEVRWIREHNDLTPDVFPGMGLQFEELPAGAQESIASFIERRIPLFYD